MKPAGVAVHGFRLRLRNSTTKATDHELQKHDNFTRYGQPANADRFDRRGRFSVNDIGVDLLDGRARFYICASDAMSRS
ncbi:hypothetical protein J6497_11910 [Bradyrhizobium sp. CNPSo 4026]|nr:hypothetical protein [Bradyrhizobium cenepequi]